MSLQLLFFFLFLNCLHTNWSGSFLFLKHLPFAWEQTKKKAGRKAVVPPTHPLWHDSHVCPSTDLLTALNLRHKDWNEANFGLIFVLKEFMSNNKEIKSSGAKYECSMCSKCWYLSVCATSLPKWFLPTHSWSPWHNSSNKGDSSCGVNGGMTLEGGSEKSQIKRTSVEVIVTD